MDDARRDVGPATEISLAESDGIRVGQRVRITVERIEAHPDGEWVSVAVRLDAPAVHADGSRMGLVHWEAPEHLEAVS